MKFEIKTNSGSWILYLGFLTLIFALLLSACGTADDIPTLVEETRGGNSSSAKKLVAAMGSKNREIALEAYREVVSLGAVMEPWLIRGLTSKADAVVEASAAALGNVGDSGSLPALLEVLKGEGNRRYAAAWALGEIGDLSAVPVLVDALGAGDPLLKKSVVRALVKLGPEAGAPVADYLAGAVDEKSQRAAIRVVGELREKAAVDILVSIRGRNRDAAAWALGRIGSEKALEPLLGALSDPVWQVRREAAQALGDLEDSRALGGLENALEDPVTVVREWAARSLETITGRQVLYMGEDGEMIPPYNLYR